MTDNEKIMMRFNISMNFKDMFNNPEIIQDPLAECQKVYEWVVGKQSSILPVSGFTEVKK